MPFWRGAFDNAAFWTGVVTPVVFDNPAQAGPVTDFDESTALGGVFYVQRPTTGQITVTGFASVGAVRGFVGTATLGEIEAEGFTGGIVIGNSLNAFAGFTTVQGGWPGTQGKPGGLLDNASDPEGDPLSFQIMSLPAHGTLQVEFNGAFLYTPNRGFSGTDSFTWRPWANGEFGNTVTVTLLVAENRVALTGEIGVVGFAGVMGGIGLNAPATTGEITVTGFASDGLLAAFVGTATLGTIDVLGMVAVLEGELQALEGDVDVAGFTGTLHTGWQNAATIGVGVDVTGFAPVLSIGFVSRATLAQVDVLGFVSTNVEYVEQPVAAGISVTGFAPNYLELPLIVSSLAQVTVTGFAGVFSNVIILPPPAPERPSDVTFYDPRNHLPDGWRLDRPTEDALMAYWAGVSYRVLTEAEIVMIVGTPFPTPVIRREFGTGEYPTPKLTRYG